MVEHDGCIALSRWVELSSVQVAGTDVCADHGIDLVRAQAKAMEVLRLSPMRRPALYDCLYAAISDIRIQSILFLSFSQIIWQS